MDLEKFAPKIKSQMVLAGYVVNIFRSSKRDFSLMYHVYKKARYST